MAFTSRHPQDSNAQQMLCACVGLHAFMLSLAERVEHLLIESEAQMSHGATPVGIQMPV